MRYIPIWPVGCGRLKQIDGFFVTKANRNIDMLMLMCIVFVCVHVYMCVCACVCRQAVDNDARCPTCPHGLRHATNIV